MAWSVIMYTYSEYSNFDFVGYEQLSKAKWYYEEYQRKPTPRIQIDTLPNDSLLGEAHSTPSSPYAVPVEEQEYSQ